MRNGKIQSTTIADLENINKKNTEIFEGRVMSISDVRKEDCKPLKHIFYPWLNEQGLALIFAERGVGKTDFSLNVAHAIARGGEFLKGHAEQPRRVLYIDGEMPFFSIKNRISMMDKMYGVNFDPDNLHIITPDKYNVAIPDLGSPVGQDIINRHIEKLKIETVIFDNIACLMPALKGNDNDSWQALIQPWLLLLRRNNVSVAINHHSGKFKEGEKQTGRGSSGKEDILDTVISLTRPVGYSASQGARFNVEFTKNRHFHGEEAESFEAWLQTDTTGNPFWLTDNVKESTYVRVCELINKGDKQIDIAKKLHISRQRVSILVKKGFDDKLITMIGDQFTG